MTPAVAAVLTFTVILLIVGGAWAAGWWVGRTFGGDEHDTIGLP
jgi:hypothetical protein